jgi:uncharacterized protein YbjT (DUF2867 family)
MILLTGATGTTGSSLVGQLASAGVKVRALVRNRAKAASIMGEKVEIAEGDLSKPQTLDAALAGIDRVFILSSPTPQIAELEGNLVEALKRSSTIKHAVKLSVIGADPDSPLRLARVHGQVERMLEDSAIPCTFLRPHSFMQNTLSFAPTIKAQGVFYAPMGEGRIGHVDTRDIARVAAKALTEPGHEGSTYTLTGPEALSYADIAEKLSGVVGKKVTYVDVPLGAARQGMIGSGMSEWLADGLCELYSLWHDDRDGMTTRDIQEVTKREPVSYDRFARDYAESFRS